MRCASNRRADVQGLRALAVLLVVGYHAGLPLPSGFAGVDVFFVISGFVITATLVRELADTGRLRLGAFYARRVRRLLPALTLVLVFVAAVGVLGSPIAAQKTAGLTGIAAALFSANFYLYHLGSGYFDVSAGLNPLLHTWTLGVEEQFYLVFPALLLVSWKLGRRALALVAIGGATALSFYLAYRYALAYPVGGVQNPQRFGFYASPSRAWEFGAGSLVALGVPLFRRIPFGLADVVAAAGLAWLVVGLLVLDGPGVLSAGETAALVTGVSLLLVAGSGRGSLVARGLGARPAVWIGDLSYSWYLWHWPLIVFARALWPGTPHVAVAAAALSLLPAWLSYRYVENPIRVDPRVRGKLVVALGAACVAIAGTASAGLALAPRGLAASPQVRSWQRMERFHADYLRGCSDAAPLGSHARCTWHVRGSRGEVVLIGDSNAGQFTEPFVRAAHALRLTASVATYSSCPFVDLHVSGTNSGDAACWTFDHASLRELLRRRPRLVVIAARTDHYLDDPSIGLGGSHSQAAKTLLWRGGLERFLRRLGRAGIPTLVVHPVPVLAIDPGTCAVLRVLTGSCTATATRRSIDRLLRASDQAESAAVAAAPRSSAVSFERLLCSRVCASARGGRMLYRDSTHLSVEGALTLTPEFEALLSRRSARSAGSRASRSSARPTASPAPRRR
jgi:peptidoglycan/LPS O-acetylase OafA/YrhL